MQDLSSDMCEDKLKTACYFIATPWVSLDVENLTACSRVFLEISTGGSDSLQKRARQRARGSALQRSQCSPGGQTWAQGQKLPRGRLQAPSKEDLSNRESCSTTEWTAW